MKITSQALTQGVLYTTLVLATFGQFLPSVSGSGLLWAALLALILHIANQSRTLLVRYLRLDVNVGRLDEVQEQVDRLEREISNLKTAKSWKGQ
jgi:hypothetical protein